MDKEKIKNFITTQRASGIPDAEIYSFLKSKGVDLTQSQPKPDFLSKITEGVNSIFPGGKIGEAIGTSIAKNSGDKIIEDTYSKLTPEAIERLKAKGVPTTAQEAQREVANSIKGPTGLEVVGDVAQIGSFFLPYGRMAGAISKIGGKTIGNIASGLIGGYTADVGVNLAGGKTGKEALSPGLGTVIGGAIPAAGPVARGLKKVTTEGLGLSTGVGSTTLKEFGNAIRSGGTQADEAIKALRGNTSPEQIVNTAKSSLGEIYSNRTNNYVKSLESLKGAKESLDISPIINQMKSQLNKFNISVLPEGGLDFSRSTLRFNKSAQQEIQTVFEEMKGFGLQPGDRTIIGVDSLKRAFGDLFSDSSEARAFIQAMKKEAEKVANTVSGYKEMTSKYAEDTGLIREITKGLSLGDKVSMDTSFKKLTSALKTNNEFRKQLVDELNAVSGGKLIPQITGQQLSEILPRGLVRPLAGTAAGAGLLSGVGILPVLQAILVTSPRLVGEVINALGFTARQVDKVKKIIQPILIPKGAKFPGDMILDKTKSTPNKSGGFVKVPSLKGKGTIPQNSELDRVDKFGLTPVIKDDIVAIIDDYRLNKGKKLELQEDAARIAEDLGIKMPKTYGALVKKLEDLLVKSDNLNG